MAKTARKPRAARRRNRAGRGSAFASVGGIPRAVSLSPALGQKYRMSRTLSTGIAKTASDSGRIYAFALGDVPSSAEFTSLFAEWRIDSVHCHFQWVPPTTIGPTPRLITAFDPTATTAPASVDAILQRRHTVWNTSPTSRDYCIIIKPQVTDAVIATPSVSGTTSNAVSSRGQFMSTGAPSVQHGNLLVWVQFFNDGLQSAGDINMMLTYNFTFRGLR